MTTQSYAADIPPDLARADEPLMPTPDALLVQRALEPVYAKRTREALK